MNTATVTVTTPEAMQALGCRLGAELLRLHPATGGGIILGLEGDLGAGKTTFVRGLVQSVTGIEQVVTSPTFQLMNLYRSAAAPPRTLAHIDAYRLTGAQAFWELGIAELLEENVIIAVEWPSRTQHSIFETDAFLLQFDHVNETTRQVTLIHQPTGRLTDLTLPTA